MLDATWGQFQERVVVPLRWYFGQLGQQFLIHDCMTRAGALTYTTLFAVVPMMTVAYAMFSVLPEFESVGERIQEYIFRNFVPDSSAVVQERLLEFSARARQLTAAGFLVLFVTAFMMLVSVEKTFNTIWSVAEPRRGLQRFLLYWGVLSLGPPLIAAGIFISLYLISLPLVADLDGFGLDSAVLDYLPSVLTAAGLTVLFLAVPNCRVPFHHALAGGILTMFAFELAQKVFRITVANSSMEPIYGTFAAVPLFLIWLYLVWVLILSGAIFVRTLSLKRDVPVDNPEPLVVKCSRVVKFLHGAHMEGRSVTDSEINDQVPLARAERERVFEALLALKLVRETDDAGWMLGRSLKTLTLWDLYRALPEGVDARRLDTVEGMKSVVEPLKAFVQFGSNQMAVSLDSVFGESS